MNLIKEEIIKTYKLEAFGEKNIFREKKTFASEHFRGN